MKHKILTSSSLSKSDIPAPSQTVPARKTAQAAIRTAIEQKARDALCFDARGCSDIADYFVIASGTSERHATGIADKINASLKSLGEEPLSRSGLDSGGWILLDYGNVIVHIFHEPVRQYYRLDELWEKAKQVELPEDLIEEANQLRTGMF